MIDGKERKIFKRITRRSEIYDLIKYDSKLWIVYAIQIHRCIIPGIWEMRILFLEKIINIQI
jgi:hypothetical protein